MDLSSALQTYFTEARELLEDMESQLLALDEGSVEDLDESVNAVFRAAHTIKGSAGLFDLTEIVSFTHTVENVLDEVRGLRLVLDPELISLLLKCKDHIQLLVDVAAGGASGDDIGPVGESLSQALGGYLNHTANVVSDASTQLAASTEVITAISREQSERVDHDHWHLIIEFGENTYRDGMEPLSFISYLSTLGRVVQINPITNRFPTTDEYDAESCVLSFEIGLESQASRQQIEDVFEFVLEDSTLHIVPPHSELNLYLELIESMPEMDLMLGEMMVNCGALTPTEMNSLLNNQARVQRDNTPAPIGKLISQNHEQLKPVVESAVAKQRNIRENINKEQKSLRVDAEKLDVLINLIGELITAGAGTALQARQSGDEFLIESVGSLNGLLEEVRDAALNLRMVPIGATFGRFQRVVRDIAKDLNKEVKLNISGADTEMDKSVVEKIGDPLMHLVRNALDHGIESPDVRLQKSKSTTGQLSLNAFHDSGSIVIEVKDDGKGLDAQMLRQKAIERGLMNETEQRSDEDLYQLIFEPGFSTAQTISNISGRGVGMDVVRRNINELRGRINVDSELGKGTTVRLSLPLTLAIIEGFAIAVGEDVFVVPLELVQECVELPVQQVENGDTHYFNLRGQVLPLISLREHLTVEGPASSRKNIVVVQAGSQRAGLVVDKLLGELQTVIKPLGELFSRVAGISGSTIMGNGDVALILDVPGLMQSFMQKESEKKESWKSA